MYFSTTQPVILFVDIGVQVKRESPASGSWKIQEEIRRIRLKATEELLRTPSAKLDWSSFASDHKSNSSSARSDYLKIASGDQMQHAVRSIDKSTNRSPDNTVIHNLLGTHFYESNNVLTFVKDNEKCLNSLSVIWNSINIVNLIRTLTESKTTRDVSENKTCLLGTTSIVLQQDKVTDSLKGLVGSPTLNLYSRRGQNGKIAYLTVKFCIWYI